MSKDFRFYADMPDHWLGKSATKDHRAFTRETLTDWAARGVHCNVIAVALKYGRPYGSEPRLCEAIVPTFGRSNSDTSAGQVARDYLDKRTVRISEELARKLHPALFERLDADD